MTKLIAGVLAALILMTSAASAAPLSFRIDVTGDDFVNGGQGSFSFLVTGLLDDTDLQTAASVIIESATFGNGIAQDLSLLSEGTVSTDWFEVFGAGFTVSGGDLTSASFRARSLIPGTSLDQDLLQLNFIAGVRSDGVLRINQENGFDFSTSVKSLSITQVSSVPLPAPILMLLSVMGGLVLLARRRERELTAA